MSDPLPKDGKNLEALRREIDAVDAELHRLLIRRGEVIEELIAAKGGAGTGSAFRPDREAEMLSRLVARHSGVLPLATVEHIWREIIGTFTQLQAPFSVHAPNAGAAATRDMLRFHFGFATPLIDQPSPAAVIAAIRDNAADLGVIPLDRATAYPWWSDLSTKRGDVKIIATLPFLSQGDSWPRSLVLGPAEIDNPAADVSVRSALAEGPASATPDSDAVEVIARTDGRLLLACRVDSRSTGEILRQAGLVPQKLEDVGGYCAPPADFRS
jgi:chorismate mutase / prephenate dehydratase